MLKKINVMWQDTIIGQFDYDLESNTLSNYTLLLSNNHPLLLVKKFLTEAGMINILKKRSAIGLNKNKLSIDPSLLHNYNFLIQNGHLASLSDTLWIKYSDTQITWKDINLYDKVNQEFKFNVFSDRTYNKISTLTLLGYQNKIWKYETNNWVLYKIDNPNHNDAKTETIVSNILNKLCIGCVLYEEYTAQIVKCSNFTNKDKSLIPIDWFLDSNKNKIQQLQKLYQKEKFNELMLIDLLLNNVDRHLYNFGLIYDDQTKSFYNAPIYDNGLSLYNGFLHHYNNLIAFVNNQILDVNEQEKEVLLKDLERYKNIKHDVKTYYTYEIFLNMMTKLDLTHGQILKDVLNEQSIEFVHEVYKESINSNLLDEKSKTIVELNYQYINDFYQKVIKH